MFPSDDVIMTCLIMRHEAYIYIKNMLLSITTQPVPKCNYSTVHQENDIHMKSTGSHFVIFCVICSRLYHVVDFTELIIVPGFFSGTGAILITLNIIMSKQIMWIQEER